MKVTFAQMKLVPFIIIISIIVFACNSGDNSTAKTDTVQHDALKSFTANMQEQLKEFPDSAGLRLQYAFALTV